jgi:hypothetical protein
VADVIGGEAPDELAQDDVPQVSLHFSLRASSARD